VLCVESASADAERKSDKGMSKSTAGSNAALTQRTKLPIINQKNPKLPETFRITPFLLM
jgi:hypothetical protein